MYAGNDNRRPAWTPSTHTDTSLRDTVRRTGKPAANRTREGSDRPDQQRREQMRRRRTHGRAQVAKQVAQAEQECPSDDGPNNVVVALKELTYTGRFFSR